MHKIHLPIYTGTVGPVKMQQKALNRHHNGHMSRERSLKRDLLVVLGPLQASGPHSMQKMELDHGRSALLLENTQRCTQSTPPAGQSKLPPQGSGIIRTLPQQTLPLGCNNLNTSIVGGMLWAGSGRAGSISGQGGDGAQQHSRFQPLKPSFEYPLHLLGLATAERLV